MTQTSTTRLRAGALIALATSLLAAAVPMLASSPIVSSWVWVR